MVTFITCNGLRYQRILRGRRRTNLDNSKGKVDGVATPPISAVQERARVLVDPEVLEAVVRGAGTGVHLKALRATKYRPVNSDRSFGKDDLTPG